MQMMQDWTENVGMNYHEVADSRWVAQPEVVFLFPWEEAGSAENPVLKYEDEGFSETMTSQNTSPHQPLAMKSPPALHSIEDLQNSSTARQLFG